MFSILLFTVIAVFSLTYYGLLSGHDMFTHDAFRWCGSFYYFVDSLAHGSLPLWDPYSITGTPFYPNFHGHGLLDPLILTSVLMVKVFGLSPLTAWVYFNLLRLFVFILGAYFLFKHVSGCRLAAVLSSGILLFAIAPADFRQNGLIEIVFLTPFMLFFVLKFIENVREDSKYLYLACLALLIGISLNVYIPVYFAFNLVVFVVVLILMGFFGWSDLRYLAGDRRFAAFSLGMLFLVFLMAAPALTVFREFSNPHGEHFPSMRILQKNRYVYKKIVASDVGEHALSDRFHKRLGVYNSYGNLLNVIYPDMYRSYFMRKDFFSIHGYMAETLVYIGIIPFVFCIIGFINGKSRYRYVAAVMMAVILIITFSFRSIVSEANLVQNVFSAIFPPLKMIDVKETFTSFFLLYMAMLLSIGLKTFFDREGLPDLINRKHRQIIIICLAILSVKFAATYYFWGKLFFTSRLDLFAVVILLFFAALIAQFSRGLIRERLFYGLVLFLIFADLAYYNIQVRQVVLQPNSLGRLLASQPIRSVRDRFEYFRIPFMDTAVAFGETVFKIKGAISKGNNHHMLTTKRYYDYMTHVPLENQFVLSGCVYPVIRFFPNDKVKIFHDRSGLLNYFATEENPWALGQYLCMEEDEGKEDLTPEAQTEFRTIEQYEDVLWLRRANIISVYAGFVDRERERFIEVRDSRDKYMDTPEYKLTVKEFGLNGITIAVSNKIDGYLYYNDGWSRYWEAYDGDVRIPIKIANYNFKAVFLEKGEHVIHFVYNPKHYKLALLSCQAGIISCFFLLVFLRLKTRR